MKIYFSTNIGTMPLFSRTRSRSSEAVSGGFSSSNMASFTSTATAQELGRRGPGAAPGTAPAYAYSSGMGGVPMMAATPSGATVAGILFFMREMFLS